MEKKYEDMSLEELTELATKEDAKLQQWRQDITKKVNANSLILIELLKKFTVEGEQ